MAAAKQKPTWKPKHPRLPPGVEKSWWIDRVRVDRESWRKYRLGFQEAKRIDPELTWSGFLRLALDELSEKFLAP